MVQKPSTTYKWSAASFFTMFLIANAFLVAMAAFTEINTGQPLRLLAEDVATGARILIFIAGVALAWFVGNQMVKLFMRGHITVPDAVSASWSLVLYVALGFICFAFVGVLHWAALALGFLVLLAFSVGTFWRMLGGLLTGSAIFIAIVAGMAAFFLAAV